MVRIGTGPPFDRWIMQIQPILGYFGAILGLYQPPGPLLDLGPPFYISWIRPWVKRKKWLVDNYHSVYSVVAPEIFMGGIEGENAFLRGQKIQKFAENGWFFSFFLLTGGGGGQVGAEPLTGGHMPLMPPPLMPPLCILSFVILSTLVDNKGIFIKKKNYFQTKLHISTARAPTSTMTFKSTNFQFEENTSKILNSINVNTDLNFNQLQAVEQTVTFMFFVWSKWSMREVRHPAQKVFKQWLITIKTVKKTTAGDISLYFSNNTSYNPTIIFSFIMFY